MSELKLSAGDGRADRGGADAPPRPPRRPAVSRHGAISRDLTKYASYKSWAEKVRGAFAPEAGADPEPGVNGHANGRR